MAEAVRENVIRSSESDSKSLTSVVKERLKVSKKGNDRASGEWGLRTSPKKTARNCAVLHTGCLRDSDGIRGRNDLDKIDSNYLLL